MTTGGLTSRRSPPFILPDFAVKPREPQTPTLPGHLVNRSSYLRSLLFVLFVPIVASAENWPTWRGPDTSGISAEKEPHSTMVVLILTPTGSAHWAHVGDSRLYRFSGPNFAERTIDHSFVESMVAQGKFTPEQAKNHRLSNILVNVLGSMRDDPFVTLGRLDGLKPGDAFLLASDGLWHYFSDEELGAAIAMNSPRGASEMLIRKARERAEGMEADNCSLAIVKLIAPPPPEKGYTVQKMRRAV